MKRAMSPKSSLTDHPVRIVRINPGPWREIPRYVATLLTKRGREMRRKLFKNYHTLRVLEILWKWSRIGPTRSLTKILRGTLINFAVFQKRFGNFVDRNFQSSDFKVTQITS